MSSLPVSAATAVALFAATNVDDLVVLTLLSASSRASGRPRRWEIWAGQYLGFAVLVGLSLAAGRGLSLLPTRWLWLLAFIPLAVGAVALLSAVRDSRRSEHSSPPPAPGRPGAAGPPQTAVTPAPSGSPSMSISSAPVGPPAPPGSPSMSTSSAPVGPAAPSGPPSVPAPPGLPRLPRAPGVFSVRGLSWMAGVAGVATLTVVDGSDNLAAYTPVFATAAVGRIAVVLTVFAVGVAVWCTAGTLLTRHHRITDTLARYGRWILPAAFILIGLYTLHTTDAPIHL